PNGETRSNIMPKEGNYVLGVIYVIEEKCYDLILKSEPEYKMIDVDVQLYCDQTILKAKVFVTDNITSEYLIPSNEYLETILTGARQHKLSEEYINYIISIANIK